MILQASNVYYFQRISRIGGIEQFFYELAKKYGNKGKQVDLVVVYKEGDASQLARLRKLIKCVRYEKGMDIECKRAFFNFNTDIIDSVKADEYILVVHGNYHMLGCPPPRHEKITKVVAVSKDSAKAYTELTGLECGVSYNPLGIEPPQRILRLVTACRLEDRVKGGTRVKELVKALDEYCATNGTLYTLAIFTNSTNVGIDSPNVVIRSPRVDVRHFLADADYVIQLSDNVEGYCYTVNEALMYGTPVVITPCDVFKELGIDNTMSIQLNFDLSNIKQVVEDMFIRSFIVKYKPPKDSWDDLLILDHSDYTEQQEKTYRVKALKTMEGIFDLQAKVTRHEGDEFEVTYDRMAELKGENRYGIKYVEEV